MPRTPTEAQIEASRRNGARSHGPVTPEGKRISAQNGRRLTVNPRLIAESHILPGESLDALQSLTASVLNKYAPRDEVELGYVNIAVSSLWRLQRIWTIDQASMIRAAAKNAEVNGSGAVVNAPNGQWSIPAAQVAEAFKAVHGATGHGSTMQIAESRYDRQYERAIRQLDRIKAKRAIMDGADLEGRSGQGVTPESLPFNPDCPTQSAPLGYPEKIENRGWEPENCQYLLDFSPNREPENSESNLTTWE